MLNKDLGKALAKKSVKNESVVSSKTGKKLPPINYSNAEKRKERFAMNETLKDQIRNNVASVDSHNRDKYSAAVFDDQEASRETSNVSSVNPNLETERLILENRLLATKISSDTELIETLKAAVKDLKQLTSEFQGSYANVDLSSISEVPVISRRRSNGDKNDAIMFNNVDRAARRNSSILPILQQKGNDDADLYKTLYRMECKKNSILSDQLEHLNIILKKFKVFDEKNEDEKIQSVKKLQEKNDELYKNLVNCSDDCYELKLENKQLKYQKDQIYECLKEAKEEIKEMDKLKEHIYQLLKIVNDLKHEIKKESKLRSTHNTSEESKEGQPVDFLARISHITEKSKLDLFGLLKERKETFLTNLSMIHV